MTFVKEIEEDQKLTNLKDKERKKECKKKGLLLLHKNL